MGMGACIGLITVGAILTFAVNWHMHGVNVHLAGLIMMVVGFVGLNAYVAIYKRRRVQPPPPAAPVVEEDHRMVR
ncbi:hypothetical protein [Streptomyces orinoci]|uniref:Integral membrane protein n=1 Tax=Streptomyces orinoci TaxID=67339 RepID=A0ABV3K134_STRON|nr:hypothetical protein [Streptomyces orinoci]